MQHHAYHPRHPQTGSVVLTLGLLVLPGCLVPLPLQQQNSVDGGQLLMISSAVPPFGTQVATKVTDNWKYTIDVVSDSPSLAGRLYRKVDGSCCDVDLTNPRSTRFQQQAQVTRLAPDKNLYSVEFNNQVVPCDQDQPAGFTIFIVPVLASGGFLPDPVEPDGIGVVDRTHYWTVRCP